MSFSRHSLAAQRISVVLVVIYAAFRSITPLAGLQSQLRNLPMRRPAATRPHDHLLQRSQVVVIEPQRPSPPTQTVAVHDEVRPSAAPRPSGAHRSLPSGQFAPLRI